MPGTQRRLKGCLQLLRAGVHTVFQVARHQGVVFFNDLVNQGAVCGGH